MAEIAIFIIGADMLLLKCLAVMSRLAMKYSKFNLIWVFAYAKSTVYRLIGNYQSVKLAKNQFYFIKRGFYKGIFFFISSTILKAAGQIATFCKVKSEIC